MHNELDFVAIDTGKKTLKLEVKWFMSFAETHLLDKGQ